MTFKEVEKILRNGSDEEIRALAGEEVAYTYAEAVFVFFY